MPILPLPLATAGETATAGLFGGNILAPRAPMTGPGSYAEAVEALGVTSLRYPGGSLTESFFDLSDPDATIAFDNETGEAVGFMPLSDVMAFADDTDRAVTIVLPTREQISDTAFDDNGDRFAAVDEAELRGFVREVVTGTYGDAPVAGFEIGNEYWGSGRMNAVEYGRVASEMTRIIDSELEALAPLYPEAAEIDILVQMGTNFGESSLDEAYEGLSDADIAADLNATYGLDLPLGAGISWTEVNNLLVLEQFDPAELDAVDGIIAHVYSRGPDQPHTRYFPLDQIQQTWFDENPDLEIHVTEWNLRANSDTLIEDSDYGLFQAQEMLEQVEAFMAEGVDAAQVWPLIQNTPSALSLGFEYSDSTVPGEMFALMSANLPGMTLLDFSPDDARESEFEDPDMEVHGFADGNDLLLYITAPQGGGVVQSGVDLRALVADVGGVEALVLGVAPGQAPGDTSSQPVIERLDPVEVYEDGQVDVVLAEGEILQIRLVDVTPTADFAPIFDRTDPDAATAGAALVLDDPAATEIPELADLEVSTTQTGPGRAVAADLAETRPVLAGEPAQTPVEDLPDGPDLRSAWAGMADTVPALEPAFAAAAPNDALTASGAADLRPVHAFAELVPQSNTLGDFWADLPQGISRDVALQDPTAADPHEAAQSLLRIFGFSSADQGDALDRAEAFPFLQDEDAPDDPDEEPGANFDDMGLGWALAALPLLAMAGLG